MQKTIFNSAYALLVGRLRTARIARGFTQADVGKLLGCSRHWIQKIEACQVRVDVLQLIKLGRVYGISAADLVKAAEEELP